MKALWERKPLALTFCLLGAGLLTSVQLALQTSAQDRELRSASRAMAQQTAAQIRAFIETRKAHASKPSPDTQDLAQAIHVFNQAMDPRMIQVRRVELLPLAEVPAESVSLRDVDGAETTVLFKVLSLEERLAIEVQVKNSELASFGYTVELLGDLHILQLFLLWSGASFLGLQWWRIRRDFKERQAIHDTELANAEEELHLLRMQKTAALPREQLLESWGRFKDLLRVQGSEVRNLLTAVKGLRQKVFEVLERGGRSDRAASDLGALNSAARGLNQARTQWKNFDAQFYQYALQWEKMGGDPVLTDALTEKIVSLRTQTEEAFKLVRELEKKLESGQSEQAHWRSEVESVKASFRELSLPIERVTASYVEQARGLEEILKASTSAPTSGTHLSQPLEPTDHQHQKWG
jgi:hypothetical protein